MSQMVKPGSCCFFNKPQPHQQITQFKLFIPYKPLRLRHRLLPPNFVQFGECSLMQVIQNTVGRRASDSWCGNTESARGCKVETGKSFCTKNIFSHYFYLLLGGNLKCMDALQLALNSEVVLLRWKAHWETKIWQQRSKGLTLKWNVQAR